MSAAEVGMTARARAEADAPRRAGQPWAGGVLLLEGGCVLLGPAGAADVAQALAVAVRAARRDGIVPPARWRTLAAVVGAAAEHGVAGRAALPQPLGRPSWGPDEIGTTQAAELLGCGPRNVRDLHARGVLPSGRLVGRVLVLDRADVLALAAHRGRTSWTTEHDRAP